MSFTNKSKFNPKLISTHGNASMNNVQGNVLNNNIIINNSSTNNNNRPRPGIISRVPQQAARVSSTTPAQTSSAASVQAVTAPSTAPVQPQPSSNPVIPRPVIPRTYYAQNDPRILSVASAQTHGLYLYNSANAAYFNGPFVSFNGTPRYFGTDPTSNVGFVISDIN